MVFAFFTNDAGATAVSGGGVTTWNLASSFFYNAAGPGAYYQVAIWWGIVTTTGASTITVTDGALGSNYAKLWCREFSAASAQWGLVAASPPAGSSGSSDLHTGTTLNYPSLTSSPGGNDLYVGACYATSYVAGTSAPPGFSFEYPGQDPFEQDCFNTAVSGTIAPVGSQASSGNYFPAGVIFTADASGNSVSSNPAYATSHSIIAGGTGSWSNPGNAQGPPSGSYATWTAP